MKRLFLSTVLLCTLLSTGCSTDSGASTPPSSTSIRWAEVIKFDDITYLATHSDAGRPLKKEDLGPKFAEVKHRLQGNVDDPGYRIKNGDAGYLNEGTPVYEVEGYDPSFRLAAYDGKAPKLYEVMMNPRAEEVSDLLDIEGKVRHIGVNGDFDGTSRELAAIKDREEVRSLVSMVVEAPLEVKPGSFDDNGKVYFLVFYLEDGTAMLQTYYADRDTMHLGGTTHLGITLPEEFQRTIERAVKG